MSIRRWIGQSDFIRRKLKWPNRHDIFVRMAIDPEQRSAWANQASGPLAKMYFEQTGRVIHKWVHYLEIYERHFAQYRGTPVRMLEIGVSHGGSLEMWRRYLGDDATIYGIDINPACADRVTAPNQVRIGSQDDPEFLKNVIREMGIPDIVLDDGSHIASHQRKTFDVLFPLLKPGALYVMEDLHTAYWPGLYGGGHGRKDNAIGHVKQMIDDMHAWYHNSPEVTPAKTEIGAIHVYDSMVFIEKVKKPQPGHLHVGASVPHST